MNCRQVNRYLLDYVDDVGRQDVRNQITAHIQECNQCRANYYLAKAENEVLRQPLTLPSAPADFSEKVMRIIHLIWACVEKECIMFGETLWYL